jgi:hypothetical protein
LFGSYPLRRLEAEVLEDVLTKVSGIGDTYASEIPEPFTFLPPDQRAVTLGDGSITSPTLEMFGRPPRDSGLEAERSNQLSAAQRLHLLNSSRTRARVRGCLRNVLAANRGRPDQMIDALYLTLLTRPPTASETAAARAALQPARDAGGAAGRRLAVEDLAWALINSKEFLHRH